MKAILKRFLIVLVVFIVLVQLVPGNKNFSPHIFTQELYRVYNTPDNVQATLRKACYDCHSGNTHYPWYSHVQPVGWWLDRHVKDGKRHLDFYMFGTYTNAKKVKKLKEVAETLSEGEMPLSSYTLMHNEARLTPEEKDAIISWANALAKQIADTAKMP